MPSSVRDSSVFFEFYVRPIVFVKLSDFSCFGPSTNEQKKKNDTFVFFLFMNFENYKLQLKKNNLKTAELIFHYIYITF